MLLMLGQSTTELSAATCLKSEQFNKSLNQKMMFRNFSMWILRQWLLPSLRVEDGCHCSHCIVTVVTVTGPSIHRRLRAGPGRAWLGGGGDFLHVGVETCTIVHHIIGTLGHVTRYTWHVTRDTWHNKHGRYTHHCSSPHMTMSTSHNWHHHTLQCR